MAYMKNELVLLIFQNAAGRGDGSGDHDALAMSVFLQHIPLGRSVA
jgi:hypothetical protein